MRPSPIQAAIALFALSACSDPAPVSDNIELPTINVSTDSEPAADTGPTALAPLTAEGWGPLKIGMTREEVIAAAGPDSNPEAVGGAEPDVCDQFHPANTPDGMLVMLEQNKLTRISLIREATVRTDPGIGLGATAQAIRAAYPDDLEITPHKYQEAPAAYLDVWSNVDNGAATIDNPDARGIRYVIGANGRTEAIHAGGPSIRYVEGCL